MGRLKVVKAQHAGACYGVQRALDMTLAAAEQGGSVCTFGPLIHNPRVVEELEAQGIGVADSVEGVESDKVVIRSHGVVPQVLGQIEQRGAEVVDATCPHVMRAQRAAAKLAIRRLRAFPPTLWKLAGSAPSLAVLPIFRQTSKVLLA